MAPSWKRLTPREQEALTLLARGMASNQIASSMCITLGSVQNILQGVRHKLAVGHIDPGRSLGLVAGAGAEGRSADRTIK